MRIVFAAPLFPLPVDGGAKIRLLRHLEVLSGKHELIVVTMVRTPEERELSSQLAGYGEVVPVEAPHRRSPAHRLLYRACYTALSRSRGWPMDAYYGCPGAFSQAVRDKAERAGADLVHYDFWFAALGDLESARYRRVMLEHDVEYVRRRRDFENASDSARGELRRKWLTTERAEKAVLKSVDCVLTVTVRDAEEVLSAGARRAVTLPTGIDTEACRPPEAEPDGARLVYVGAYSHHPNVDAMLWFANDIFPLVRKRHPEARLQIVGSAPPPEVQDLEKRDGITVTGPVPEVAPYLMGASVSIAPLRVGSGIKGKIIEAMAFGRPVVTTAVGAEGMGLTDGENVIVADGADAFAASVCELLSNRGKALSVGRAGRQLVVERHSQAAADARLLDIYEKDVWEGP